ncbi:MAG: acyl carrier protein [Lachnospiraceae bacterium]|nr:acyl carrier protein [Lachnospiraceae bacterium]
MNELIEALKRVNPKIDYENETGLVSNKIIDSIDMTSILAELEETFDIEIDMEYIVPENFDSVQAMWDMIQELRD